MGDDAGKNSGSAGNSSDLVDVEAVFERLKEDVRASTPAGGVDRRGGPVGARAEAERLWPVAVAAIERRPGIRGVLAYPAKRLVRVLVGWYVDPFVSEQRSFNYQVLRLVDELSARLRALEERIRVLEATGAGAPSRGRAPGEIRRAPPGPT